MEVKEGNSFIKYSANYAQLVRSKLRGLTHSLLQLTVHILLVKAYLVQNVDQEPILLPLVHLVVHQPTLLDDVVQPKNHLGTLNNAK